MNNLLDIPYDIIIYILEHLNIKDIISLSECSKKSNEICKTVVNEYTINLNISKVSILDNINKFPNIKFIVNIINDDRYITSDINILKNIKYIDNIVHLKLNINKDLYEITIPKNLKKLELFCYEQYNDREDILNSILDMCPDGLLTYLRVYFKLFIDLKSLSYFKDKLYNLKELFLVSNYIENFEFLKDLKLLRKLSIESIENIQEDIISKINDNLIYLKLSNFISNNINSISEKLVNLNILYLDHSSLYNLSTIYLLSNLEDLTIRYNNNLVDISPISRLKKLKSLNLSLCENLTDIYCIRYMTNIEKINLSGTSIYDLEPLKDLKKLKSIDIFDCSGILDISHISNIENIELGFCLNIRDFSILGENVKELSVSNTSISDLSHLINVISLDISYNDNITCIDNLSNLEIIDITHCTNLKDISNLVNIKEITSSSIIYDSIYPFTIAKKIVLTSVNTESVNFSFKLLKNCTDLEILFTNEIDFLYVNKQFDRLVIKGYVNELIIEEDIKSLSVRNINNIININRVNLVI
jgi:hypothetical protein